MALKDGNISLECVAASSTDSPMTIEWKKDHIVSSRHTPSLLTLTLTFTGINQVNLFSHGQGMFFILLEGQEILSWTKSGDFTVLSNVKCVLIVIAIFWKSFYTLKP